jgi:hypothetical protein
LMPCGILLPSPPDLKKDKTKMTLTNPKVVVQTLKAKGILEDMQMERIYKYESSFDGKVQFALFPDGRFDDMAGSPYVKNAVLLFDNPELTDAGKEFIKSQGVSR